MLNKLLISCALFVMAGIACAQDADLDKLLQGEAGGAKSDWKTGFNGQIPMDAIIKAIQGTKGGPGKEMGASEADYAEAAKLISELTSCTDTSCVIKGNSKFLGVGRNLDVAINMVSPGQDKGLKIDMKLLDASGKVLNSMSEPFDPASKDSLNSATMSAAKKVLSEKDTMDASLSSPDTVGGEESDDALYSKLYSSGVKAYNARQYAKAIKFFKAALELADTPQARTMLSKSRQRLKAQKQPKTPAPTKN